MPGTVQIRAFHVDPRRDDSRRRRWDNPDNFPDGGFPAVRELFEELRERRSPK